VRLWALALTFPEQYFFGKYLVLGRELLDSGLIADRPFSYSPIYCYFIALTRGVFGDALYPVLLVQTLIGALTCVLIYLIARRFVGPGWALYAAGVACLYRSFVLYDVTFLSDALGLFLQMSLLWVLSRPGFDRSTGQVALAGALIGLCILQRPNNLLLIPLVLLALALRRTPVRDLLTGTPGTTASNPGYILYSSHNASSYGFRYSPPELYYRGNDYYERRALETGHAQERFLGDAEIATAISGAITGDPMTLSSSSRFYLGFTLSHVGRYPLHYANLVVQRLGLAFNALEAHDVLPVFARYEVVAGITPLTYGLVAPLGLLGLVLSLRRFREHLALYVILANQLALLVVFYVVVRFRLSVEAVLILTSALALRALWSWVRARETRRLVVAGIALAGLAAACWALPSALSERARGRKLDFALDDARRVLQRGDARRAAEKIESLLGEDTEQVARNYEARQLLASVYRRSGLPRRSGSVESLLDFDTESILAALEERRRDGSITHQELRYLARLYVSEQRWPQAEAVLEQTLLRRPQDPRIRYELARAQLYLNRVEPARENLLAAVRDGLLFTTRGMQGCWLLAEICRSEGEAETAREWERQAVRLSILVPWYADDAESSDLVQRLRESPDYEDPGSLSALFPY